MFGKNKYKKMTDEVIRLNDGAIEAEKYRDVENVLLMIDKAMELVCQIKPYQLLNWIVEFNYTRYHHLYEQYPDKQLCLKRYGILRDIARYDMTPEGFGQIKDMYGDILVNMMVLSVDEKKDIIFNECFNEIFELLQNNVFSREREKSLYISASGMTASYYIRQGNYAVAIRYGSNVLDETEFDEIINEQKLFFLNQLIYIYMGAGQIDRAIDLGRFLYVKYLKGEIEVNSIEEIHRMILGYLNALGMHGNNRLELRVLNKSFENGIMDDKSSDTYAMNLYLAYIDVAERCSVKINSTAYDKVKILLEQRKNKKDFRAEFVSEESSLDMAAYKLAKMSGEDYEEFLDSVYERYEQMGCPEIEFDSYASQMTILMREYGLLSRVSKLKKCGEHLMGQLHKNIQYCQYYIDNDRMLQALANVETIFLFAYSSLMENISEEKKFEYLLNYKNLLPTVVRQRDMKIADNIELSDILTKVNLIKDKIAQKSVSLLSRTGNSEEIEILKMQLIQYENDFSEKYGNKKIIPYYSIEELKKAIPDNSILIDIFFSESGLHLKKTEQIVSFNDYNVLETFIWIKEKESKLHYYKNESAHKVLDLLRDFTETLKIPHRKYKKKAEKLYREMFGDCMDMIENIDIIYICPHTSDANIPFDVVFSQNPGLERCKVVYMQTVRELFYKGDVSELADSCIIGNPSYSLKENYNDDIISGKRGVQLVPLPFSEYEARCIAKIYGKECYVGKRAAKRCVHSGYRLFHIATHGFSQREGVDNVWYASALSFAGIVDWLDSGVEQSAYGNGILTADEISRIELKGTELVVLSACNSGNSLLDDTNHLAGLHIAFAAAGVRYIISSLWEVDDLATAVLMQLFYEEWNSKKSVEEALLNAKNKIRFMTANEIYQYIIQKDAASVIPEEMLENFLKIDSQQQIFSHPYYWAGFVCYKNLF